MKTLLNHTVNRQFFAPLSDALDNAQSTRKCSAFSDYNFLVSGVGRVISDAGSGRDWVQRVQMNRDIDIDLSVSLFFDSLDSRRRLKVTKEVADLIHRQVDSSTTDSMDPLACHRELDGYAVYASDGHYEDAATHAKPIAGKVREQQYFCSINLRSHSATLLDIARPAEGKKKEHDMRALKRLSTADMRMGAPKGTKVLHAYDRGGIGYNQWRKWRAKGIYIISREKSNSKAMVIGINQWDKDDDRNTGIISDEIVGVFCGATMRRVRYQDPLSKKLYSYVTSQMTLPPGLIAFLYKMRWDVEKLFDEKKNKLNEVKDWAVSDTSKSIQMNLTFIAHNLMLLFERLLDDKEDIRDEKVHAKRKKRIKEQLDAIRKNRLTPNPLVINCVRITQRSLQFIRWLKSVLWSKTLWDDAIDCLRPLMLNYLK